MQSPAGPQWPVYAYSNLRRMVRAAWVLTLVGSFATCAFGQPSEEPKPEQALNKKHVNRLAKESSPYLLLHAHNPVDWYPWGPEALAKAKKENKVIFLSIGYSSCHWCHVMERESFVDDEIAKLLNENFVCIKVDREERPDVDLVYMTALQVYFQATGNPQNGGWPLSMFLTPEGEPFFGGSYFPARDGDRGQATGFLTIAKRVSEVWSEQADRIRQDAATLTRFVKQQLENRAVIAVKPLEARVGDALRDDLADQFDEQYGGFGYVASNPRRPKFPEPSNLLFLIERVRRSNDLKSSEARMLTHTLDRLAMGGIRDHVGGGFHRYSVDRFWRIPHFEKMLYDNGQLASVYAEAYALTKNDAYRRLLVELLEFVKREMTDPEGGFWSALDAESEGEEGKFNRWTREEILKTLGEKDYSLFAAAYGVDGEPNFEEKYYVPQFNETLEDVAKSQAIDPQELEQRLTPLRSKLRIVRDRRKRPLTDTKILTAWNGLMIRGFADAGRILEEPQYIETAQKAADFVLTHLRNDESRLLRTYGQGQAKLNAYLADYAFLIDGLIALHRATGDAKWLQEAEQLQEKQIALFWDEDSGGFYFTSDDHESLIARTKRLHDGAQPSGNAVSADNLVQLAKLLDKPSYLERAERTLQSASSLLDRAPVAAPRMVLALEKLLAAKPQKKPESKKP